MSALLCPRCGKQLIEMATELVDYGEELSLECPKCGMQYTAFVPLEKPVPMDIENQGFGKCPFCGSWLYWNSDFMFSDIIGEELPEDQDTLVQNVTCSQCGAHLECVYPVE